MLWSDALTSLKGVGPEVAKKFAVLNLRTVGELADYLPRRYEDYSTITPIAKLRPGHVTIRASIKDVSGRYIRRGMHITEAAASDASGSVHLVWFNQPYRVTSLKKGQEYYLSGKFELSGRHLSLMSPSVELVSDFPLNVARIVPIYRETKGLNSRQIRSCIGQVLPYIRRLPETLPQWIITEETLMARASAVEAMHFPADATELDMAKKRLGFEEVYKLVLASLLNKYELLQQQAPAVVFDEKLAQNFVKHLPFQLTDAQRKVVWQIYQDIQKTQPMNRLVEGDVGSGKTVVAAMAAAMVMKDGHQVAFMAPTELLARQHADTLAKVLAPIGYDKKVGLLVGGMSAAQKTPAYKAIARGDMQLLIGTHALIQEKVDMHALELIIIDEQHRFGVEQRKKLQAKAGHMPHVLSLTATPIPRSLALTLYGELDISVLDAKPANRKPIITKICVPVSRKQLYTQIDKQLTAGRQMFVVCPLISESDNLPAISAETMYEQLAKKDFIHRRIGLLHGKMKAEEKNTIMQQFVAHKLDILVSTTVIEVGVDVPNASIMLVEGAERFGLAQMHQLRGRVGRGEHQGYCYLMMSDSKAPSRRLRALATSNNGFRLAEFDLAERGPGAIYGTLQHGQLDLRVAKLTDVKLISSARQAAQKTIDRGEDLLQYKELYDHVQAIRAVTNLN